MLTLALAVLLSAEEPPPLLPPPLVPATPGDEVPYAPAPEYAPPPAPPPDRERTEPDTDVQDSAEGASFSASRVAVTAAISGGTAALLVGGALFFALNDRSGGGGSVLLLIVSLPAGLFLGTALGLVGHRAMGGLGSYGSHLGGGAIGGALVLLATAFAAASLRGSPDTAAVAGWVIASGAIFGMGTALMSELSSFRTAKERGISAALVPVQGGAVATAGFRF